MEHKIVRNKIDEKLLRQFDVCLYNNASRDGRYTNYNYGHGEVKSKIDNHISGEEDIAAIHLGYEGQLVIDIMNNFMELGNLFQANEISYKKQNIDSEKIDRMSYIFTSILQYVFKIKEWDYSRDYNSVMKNIPYSWDDKEWELVCRFLQVFFIIFSQKSKNEILNETKKIEAMLKHELEHKLRSQVAFDPNTTYNWNQTINLKEIDEIYKNANGGQNDE